MALGDTNIAGLSFNYNRRESDLNCLTSEELEEITAKPGMENFSILDTGNKNITTTLNEMNEGKKLWKLCIIFALVFLGLEVVLLRFWK